MFATLPQVMAAVGYAVHGFKHDSCELPAKRKDEDADIKVDDTNDCYEIGLLRQGMAYRLGSASDMKDLPPRTLQRMIIDAMQMQLKTTSIRKDFVSNAEDNYLRTLDEITNRLKMEQKEELKNLIN